MGLTFLGQKLLYQHHQSGLRADSKAGHVEIKQELQQLIPQEGNPSISPGNSSWIPAPRSESGTSFAGTTNGGKCLLFLRKRESSKEAQYIFDKNLLRIYG